MCTNFVVIARAVLFLQCGQTDPQTHKVTDETDHPSHAKAFVGVSNEEPQLSLRNPRDIMLLGKGTEC